MTDELLIKLVSTATRTSLYMEEIPNAGELKATINGVILTFVRGEDDLWQTCYLAADASKFTVS